MRCVIAKVNPVLMNLAIKHYLACYVAVGKPMLTMFTFKSLYDDAEPYPLDELVFLIEERMAEIDKEFKALPSESLAIQHSVLKNKHYRLKRLLDRA